MSRHTISAASLLAALLVCLSGMSVLAHKPITSKYTYTAHIEPIFRERCGACHKPDGVGPMSLLTYQEARPWAQSIKEMVVNLRMPPRFAEASYGVVSNDHSLSAREIDTIVEWANGGTPEGPRSNIAPTVGPTEIWSLGEPTVTLSPSEVFTLAEGVSEDIRFFAVPSNLAQDRWVRAVDVRPGAPEVVRSVSVYIDASGRAREVDRKEPGPGFSTADALAFTPRDLLSVWLPGQQGVSFEPDTGYRLPAKGDLVVRVHYKKTWEDEGQAFPDKTVIALYLTDKPAARAVQALVIAPSPTAGGSAGTDITLSETLEQDIDLLAALPTLEAPLESLRLDAIRPDGRREPLLLLSRPTPEWPARYWLRRPVSLAKGTRVEVAATRAEVEKQTGGSGLRVRLDVVPKTERRAATRGAGARSF